MAALTSNQSGNFTASATWGGSTPADPNDDVYETEDLSEQFQIRHSILVVQVNIFPVVAPCRDVVQGSSEFKS